MHNMHEIIMKNSTGITKQVPPNVYPYGHVRMQALKGLACCARKLASLPCSGEALALPACYARSLSACFWSMPYGENIRYQRYYKAKMTISEQYKTSTMSIAHNVFQAVRKRAVKLQRPRAAANNTADKAYHEK